MRSKSPFWTVYFFKYYVFHMKHFCLFVEYRFIPHGSSGLRHYVRIARLFLYERRMSVLEET